MNYHLTLKSRNAKTGAIPVSTSSRDTCPSACPLKGNGCYANSGPLALHWDKVSHGDRGTDWPDFLASVRKIPGRAIWRHNQAGDLAPYDDDPEHIDILKLQDLVEANGKSRGFTYTHYFPTPHNVAAVQYANSCGFTVNLSANSLNHADELTRHHQPIAVVLPSDFSGKKTETPKGLRVVTCPATYRDTNCKDCGLCAVSKRDYAIGFPAHGPSKRKANAVACS